MERFLYLDNPDPPDNFSLFGKYLRVFYGVPAPRFNPSPAISHARTRPIDPGAQGWAYDSLGLPEYTFIGPGVANARQFRSVQPPVYYAGQAVLQTGIGGINAGQMALQALQPNIWANSDPVM